MNSGSHTRIVHEGRVEGIGEDFIRVSIVNKSACAECRAKGVCAASEESVKTIDIPLTISTMTRHFELGETVNVVLSSSLGATAVVLAYVVPMIVLIAAILTASSLHLEELYVGLSALGAVALYYAVLFLFRKHLSRVFLFSIEKVN